MEISQSGGPGGHWHCWSHHPLSFIVDIKEDLHKKDQQKGCPLYSIQGEGQQNHAHYPQSHFQVMLPMTCYAEFLFSSSRLQ